MSQVIACQNARGIVLAADSKAVEFEFSGEIIHKKIDRLLRFSDHTAMLAGGAAKAVEMGEDLKKFLDGEKLDDVEEIYNVSLPFLANEFEGFMHERCELFPVDPVLQVYFILAGYTEKDPKRPFRLYFMWTKKKLPRLDGDEISAAYSAPRIMGLEFKLNQLAKENAPLPIMLTEIKKSMEKQAERYKEIGPPFRYAVITEEGFREVS